MSDNLKKLHDFDLYDRVTNDLEVIFASTLGIPDSSRYERDFIWGAIRRTHSLSLAMRQSIEAKNGQMVATIIRLNLDTLARFYALFWADETPDLTAESFSKQVFEGKSIRTFTLRDGKAKANDKWLIDQITPLADWIPKVYQNSCGAIHFSEFHIHQVIAQYKDFKVSMDPRDYSPNIADYQNAKTAFLHISMMLVGAVEDRVKRLNL